MGGSKKSSPAKTRSSPSKASEPSSQPVGDPGVEDGSASSGISTPASKASAAGATHPVPIVSTVTCKHLSAMTEFLKMYHLVARHLQWNRRLSRHCAQCKSPYAPLLVCLQCPQFGCWNSEGDNHLHKHCSEMGHALSVECISGVMYCSVCKVWVWTDFMEHLWEAAKSSPADSRLIQKLDCSNQFYADAGTEGSKRYCVAVRGLFNLGNTCFMNSILQTMLHNGPLRRFFLASPHRPPHCASQCARSRSGEACIACEMDALFCRIYDGQTTPVATHRMLEALWRFSRDLAGYEQQDAHELFVALRNALHADLGGTMYNCQCIVHRIFSGVLQSDLTCIECGAVAETLDPFLDVSLDIPAGAAPLHLNECLGRFTGAEQLPPGSFTCTSCHRSGGEVSKQLTIRSNPLVLSIHLKRFEHGQAVTKIDTRVIFEERLSLAPYMSPAATVPELAASLQYDLFAVVSHVGSLDSGHYTCFVRRQNDWFWIDDAAVIACTRADVFASNAYMLFYCRLDADDFHPHPPDPDPDLNEYVA